MNAYTRHYSFTPSESTELIENVVWVNRRCRIKKWSPTGQYGLRPYMPCGWSRDLRSHDPGTYPEGYVPNTQRVARPPSLCPIT